ncbi:hypothetical protein BDN70DRAFT_798321 [Pholiota conissans]|uniref:WW domain-containing protein n=1 Tax=Pholiota conissans TaxID=109636 RepID=A0A9P6D5M0_9AGAR|nr:hypothetical protein BDN70DRAFT_798321 [Pholiota conissans]
MDPSVSQIGSSESVFGIPSGWEQRLTPEGGLYYVNHNTHTTTWDDPRLKTGALARASFPAGWEQRWIESKPYFVDHNSRRTTWRDPRLTTQTTSDVAIDLSD